MNRKQRNLQYIRFKNRLRRFERAYFIQKISNQLLKENYADNFIDNTIKSNVLKIEKKYKTPLNIVSQKLGIVEDDFMMDSMTLVATYKRAV